MSIGNRIDELWNLREQIRTHEAEISKLQKQKDAIEYELIQEMDKEGVVKSTGRRASVAISESVKPQVEDWDEFWGYIHKHKAFHLLERRPSVTGCRELFELRGMIPGVVPFTKRTVNLRTID